MHSVDDLNAANAKSTTWIKGHLLNDNFGGPGLSKNLTPMTHRKNVAFQGGFEGPIKRALIKAKQLDIDGATYWYGVKITVAVGSSGGGATAPLKAVASSVTPTAIWIRVPKRRNPAERGDPEELTREGPIATGLPDLPNMTPFDPGDP